MSHKLPKPLKYLFEGLDGAYAEDPDHTQESKTGIVGTLTEAAASQVEGFTPQQIVQQEIKADGSTVVEVKYARNSYPLMYDTRGGSYVASVTAKYGETVELASGDDVPTRRGYEFDGWYSDADLTTPVEEVTISENTTVYAKWEGDVVNYKVVYMTENADDENYSYAGTVELEAKAGTEVTADANTEKPSGFDTDHFMFESSSSATVAADGSTVITVKYSRNEYTLTFEGTADRGELICGKQEHTHSRYDGCYELDCLYGGQSWNHWLHNDGCYDYTHTICRKEAHTHTDACYSGHGDLTITAKYQADISEEWAEKISPLEKNWLWQKGSGWNSDYYTGFQVTMPGESKTLTSGNDGDERRVLHYYVEDPEGKITLQGSDKKFSELTTITLHIDYGSSPTYDEEFVQIDGYDRHASTIREWYNGQENGGFGSLCDKGLA